MNKNETFREYFRRARTDPVVRAHLLENARYSRSCIGWLLLIFGVLAIGQSAYQLLFEGVWMSRSSIFYTFSFAVTWLIYDKFGDRVALLSAMDDSPNQSSDPTLASGTSPAGQEPRLR